MILGIDRHPPAECFRELDGAITGLQAETGDTRTFALNAHAFPDEIPRGAVVYNLENVGIQVSRDAFPEHAVVDFSPRNIEAWKPRDVAHFPVGYHHSMERFARAPVLDIDVVFTGCMNERRRAVLQALTDKGLRVEYIGVGTYGAERDEKLSRAKLALNVLFYPDGVFPALRVAHLVANRVPVLSERCVEGWPFIPTCDYSELVDAAVRRVHSRVSAEDNAAFSYERFKKMPMVLPGGGLP